MIQKPLLFWILNIFHPRPSTRYKSCWKLLHKGTLYILCKYNIYNNGKTWIIFSSCTNVDFKKVWIKILLDVYYASVFTLRFSNGQNTNGSIDIWDTRFMFYIVIPFTYLQSQLLRSKFSLIQIEFELFNFKLTRCMRPLPYLRPIKTLFFIISYFCLW